jgi:hypothetical protein
MGRKTQRTGGGGKKKKSNFDGERVSLNLEKRREKNKWSLVVGAAAAANCC